MVQKQVPALLALISLLAACGPVTNPSPSPPAARPAATPTPPATATLPPTPSIGSTPTVSASPTLAPASSSITASNFAFTPSVLAGQGGQRLTLAIRNTSSNLHNFSIATLGIDRDIPAGGSVQIDFAVLSGSVAFFCRYHQARGMTGQLQVGSVSSEVVPAGSRASAPSSNRYPY